ncbi:MAG: DUF4258 domain-containing protein [Gammaproteobacteria bacterium]|nr:DUF4258 domain-containing protein [Gammaproteobacteria bacterium]
MVSAGAIRISEHGYDELSADSILVRDVIESVAHGTVVEDYPRYPKGSCVLVLQTDHEGRPIHVVWGIPKDHAEPAVVVTAYRPDPILWREGFTRRCK